MKIGLVNSMFSQDAGPPVFPMELAYKKAVLYDYDVTVYDLNLEIYKQINYDITGYNLLACIFGGFTFSYPLSAFVPLNEYPFEAFPTLELFLAMLYGEEFVEAELDQICNSFGIPYDDALHLVQQFNITIKATTEQLSKKEALVINMPSPASVFPGILLGCNARKLNNQVKIIGLGNQINVPEVAHLSLAVKAFDEIVDNSFYSVHQAIDKNFIPSVRESKLPDLTGFNLNEYPTYHGLNIVPMESSFDCPYRCNFCSERMFWDYKGNVVDSYAQRPLDEVMKEIEFLASSLNLAGITFNDCILNAVQSRCDEFSTLLEGTNLLQSGSVRVDRLNDNTIDALRKARFTDLIVGVESVSEKSVKLYNKGNNNYAQYAREGIPALYEAGIIPQINILICHPYEDLDDVKESVEATYRFAKFLESRGIPFYDAPVGTVCINYPSEMYFRVLQDPNFQVIYHHVPEGLKSRVPEEVRECVEKVPFKALKNVPEEEMKVNKLDFCKEIYGFWSKDQSSIIQLRVSSLTKYEDLFFKAWENNNIYVNYLGEKPVNITSSPVQTIFSILSAEKRVLIKELADKVGNDSRKLIVPTLLTLSFAGIAEMSRGETK